MVVHFIPRLDLDDSAAKLSGDANFCQTFLLSCFCMLGDEGSCIPPCGTEELRTGRETVAVSQIEASRRFGTLPLGRRQNPSQTS